MGEPVYAFVIDGERVGLTERQYGARLARAARIETPAYIGASQRCAVPAECRAEAQWMSRIFKSLTCCARAAAPMLPCEIAAALGSARNRWATACGSAVSVVTQSSASTGKKTVRYEAAPIDE